MDGGGGRRSEVGGGGRPARQLGEAGKNAAATDASHTPAPTAAPDGPIPTSVPPTADLRPPTLVDLHTHSDHSDGRQSPTALVEEAAGRGLRVLGLTDHDTVAGVAEATVAADRVGLELVPGVELSTGGFGGAPEIHLLGYFVDPTDPSLLAGLTAFADDRLARLERIVERLGRLGVRLDAERVRALAGPGTVGRPHVAQAMVEAGYVADLREAFDRYLAAGRPGFVARPRVEPGAGIALIRGAGGVAVLAHPFGAGEVESTLGRLVPAGLVGMEAYYGEYDEAARELLAGIAARWGLIATGGSDYHGPGVRAGRTLGGPPVPMAAVEQLRAAARGGA